MKFLDLNENSGRVVAARGYELDPKQEYIIDLANELHNQSTIFEAIRAFGLPAMHDWWNWLEENGFSAESPNPTNVFVKPFFGKKELWSTNLSQGIVVKDKSDDDFYIVMECSRENTGFKYTKVVVTPGGCM
ncbi:MAG: hypothetical protein ABF619_07125 [Oenococcus oeni]